MIELITTTAVVAAVMEVDLARCIFWSLSHLSVRQKRKIHRIQTSLTAMKFSLGPFFTRFPRINGHTKSIGSPTPLLAGFVLSF